MKAARGITDAVAAEPTATCSAAARATTVVADFMPILWSYGADLFNADRSKAAHRYARGRKKAMAAFMALGKRSRRPASRARRRTRWGVP